MCKTCGCASKKKVKKKLKKRESSCKHLILNKVGVFSFLIKFMEVK